MTLDKVKRGQQIVIRSIQNELARLQAVRFGLTEGAVVTCQEVVPAGPVVVRRAQQEIAIGRDIARGIDVELV
ncbi:FeoA family protein [Desulfofalx alkaliphila]|uniref:FeoA family protein n=1 Tax=Desulfofalx alkaliphila TaxID=105483 RepID=UPI0004E1614C|nr:FeoA family protein [Desulfofalx alkaliphila]